VLAVKLTQSKFLRMTIVEWLLVIGIVALIISIILPSIQRARQPSGRLPCPSNMKEIGQAIYLYAQAHGGKCPASLAELKRVMDVPQKTFVCPDDPATHAEGESTYIYLGCGKTLADLSGYDVLAYEPLEIHEDGGDVLFGDGHVEFVEARMYKDVERGVYPPRPATSQSSG
jgi:prepilin-type processing-associated H-X9-DG protein